jgi:hypothetical protein
MTLVGGCWLLCCAVPRLSASMIYRTPQQQVHRLLPKPLRCRRIATPMIVRHERERPKGRVVRNCLTDEGRPLGIGLQEQVPNHLRRLGPKAMVVSTEGKGLARTRSGDRQEEDRKGTTIEVSKA